jgi:WSC domain
MNASHHPRGSSLLVILLLLGTLSALAQDIRRPDRPPHLPLPPPIANGAFGCLKDQGDPQGTNGRDLNGYIWSAVDMKNGVCRDGCGTRGFRYAGTQVGTYCFCGDSAGHSGESNACNTRCSGDIREVCGGIWSNSVSLATGAPLMPPPPVTIPPVPMNGGRCTINITRSGANPYRHTEIQLWEVQGPPTPLSGFPRVYPVRWTVSGNGAIQESTGAAGWTISGAADVLFRAQVIGSFLSVARVDPNTNVPYGVAGVQQLQGMNPGPLGAARYEWGYVLGQMSAPPTATVINESTQPAAGIWGYRQGTAAVDTGDTWTCQWNFML